MIEKANLKDLVSLYNIEQEVFFNDPFALNKKAIKYHLIKSRIYKIVLDENIAGYILWLERKKYFRLYSLAIASKYQNRGLAKELLEYSFNLLKEKNKNYSLEVKQSNENAIELYKKFGFEVNKTLKDYYKKEDGFLMMKKRIDA